MLLVGVKAVAVWYSSSISLMASLIDSALDLLSTFIILGTSWAMGQESDRHLYPAGKRRFEPLGVVSAPNVNPLTPSSSSPSS